MPHEIETKIIGIDAEKVKQILSSLGAQKVLETRFSVDWFRTKGNTANAWFLRVRTDSSGKAEVTWKGKHENIGASRKVEEISFTVDSTEKAAAFFAGIGLEKYAHQEKDRVSWALNEWRFDLDQYPGMAAFLEIEGKDQNHIQQAIKLLGLEGLETWPDGERTLIEKKYGLNWYEMNFG